MYGQVTELAGFVISILRQKKLTGAKKRQNAPQPLISSVKIGTSLVTTPKKFFRHFSTHIASIYKCPNTVGFAVRCVCDNPVALTRNIVLLVLELKYILYQIILINCSWRLVQLFQSSSDNDSLIKTLPLKCKSRPQKSKTDAFFQGISFKIFPYKYCLIVSLSLNALSKILPSTEV